MKPPRVDVRPCGDVVVARIEDEIDIDIVRAADLGDVLLDAVPNSARGLVLDLGAVRYVDSAGVRMLFSLARQLATSRQSLALCLPEGSPLKRLVGITKLGAVTEVCADLQSCVEAIRGPD